jgi:hypothetical protein
MKEKSTDAGLAPENGFSPAYVLSLLRLVKKRSQIVHALAREECNKYDLTAAAPCFFIGEIIMIGPGGLLLVVPTYLQAVPVCFRLIGGIAKKVK